MRMNAVFHWKNKNFKFYELRERRLLKSRVTNIGTLERFPKDIIVLFIVAATIARQCTHPRSK